MKKTAMLFLAFTTLSFYLIDGSAAKTAQQVKAEKEEELGPLLKERFEYGGTLFAKTAQLMEGLARKQEEVNILQQAFNDEKDSEQKAAINIALKKAKSDIVEIQKHLYHK